jgi:hypothetical protein
MNNTKTTTTDRAALFQVAMTAHALERIAATLERIARTDDSATGAAIDAAACELVHHADAIREASGLNEMTRLNVADIIASA